MVIETTRKFHMLHFVTCPESACSTASVCSGHKVTTESIQGYVKQNTWLRYHKRIVIFGKDGSGPTLTPASVPVSVAQPNAHGHSSRFALHSPHAFMGLHSPIRPVLGARIGPVRCLQRTYPRLATPRTRRRAAARQDLRS
jgi:hypothetical protein